MVGGGRKCSIIGATATRRLLNLADTAFKVFLYCGQPKRLYTREAEQCLELDIGETDLIDNFFESAVSCTD